MPAVVYCIALNSAEVKQLSKSHQYQRVWTTTQMPRGSCHLSLQRTGGDLEDAPHHMAEHHTAGSEIPQSHTA